MRNRRFIHWAMVSLLAGATLAGCGQLARAENGGAPTNTSSAPSCSGDNDLIVANQTKRLKGTQSFDHICVENHGRLVAGGALTHSTADSAS